VAERVALLGAGVVGAHGRPARLPVSRHLRRGAASRGHVKSQTIIAVDSDPQARIFDVAHYGAIADLLDVAAELERLFERHDPTG
jgi:hypothetical protein